MIPQNTNKHYVTLNADGFITNGFSLMFQKPKDTDVCIRENAPTHFEIDGVTNPPLYTIDRLPVYKLDKDNKPVKIPDAELKASATYAAHVKSKRINELHSFLKETDTKMARVVEEMLDGEVSDYGRALIAERAAKRAELSNLL